MFLACGAVFIIVMQLMWLHVFDVFLPNNKSERRRVQFLVTEYFIDQEKYFYLIILHINAAIIIIIITTIATGTTILIYLKYICGMFKIAR